MSYIESLKVFVRVVELGSITSGGRDLRLAPAVASKRIKELEKTLVSDCSTAPRGHCRRQKWAMCSMKKQEWC